MSPKLRTFIATATLFLVGLNVYAQKTPPAPPSRTPLPGLVAPIDDNLIILIIAGLFIGIFYIYKNHKATSNSLL